MAESDATRGPAPGEEPVSGTTPRLYERAASILTARIEAGVLGAGERVTESAVAETFGISRAPARRALEELERAGLLEKAQGRGYRVLGGASAAPHAATEALRADAPLPLHSLQSWERIYAEVEDEIIARVSFASWRINEAKLARRYEVSRTVARDVVSRLQQRGLVRKDERSRWYAPALTPDHIGELYELRAILEPAGLLRAAPNLPPGLLEQMRRHLEAAAAEGDEIVGATLDALEQEMHVTLIGHCGNQALMQAMTLPQSLLIAHRFLYRWTPRLFEREPFLPEHLEVIELLQGGKAEAAARALERHLMVSRDRAVARVDLIRREFNAEELPYLERLDAAGR